MNIGVILGTGMAKDDIKLDGAHEMPISTPFSRAPIMYTVGSIAGHRVMLLSRHNNGINPILPHNINYKANIMGFLMQNAGCILAISAVGSLREKIKPGQIVIPDQFIDLTPPPSFFSDEIFGDVIFHISMAEPTCQCLSQHISAVAHRVDDYHIHNGGTLWKIPGPRFSTRAESMLYKKSAHIIGMTFPFEAILAREAGVHYAVITAVSDFDCWRSRDASVTNEMVAESIRKFQFPRRMAQIINNAIETMPTNWPCGCVQAPKEALLTSLDKIPNGLKDRLMPIIKRIENK